MDTTYNLGESQSMVLKEISRSQKDKQYMIPLIQSTQRTQIHGNGKSNGGCQGLGGGDIGELQLHAYRFSAWEDGNILGTGW